MATEDMPQPLKKLTIGAQRIDTLKPEDRREVRLNALRDKSTASGSVEILNEQKLDYKKSKDEDLLEKTKVNINTIEPMEGDEWEAGTNINFLVELDDGSRGFLKIFDPDRENVSYPEPEKIERASYVVSQILGFDLVPATILKEIPTKGLSHPKLEASDRSLSETFGRVAMGALQKFIEEAETLEEAGEGSVSSEQLVSLYIFDYITANWDRHASNILVQGNNLYAIDNEASFFELDREAYNSLMENLQKIVDVTIPNELRQKLSDFRNNKPKRGLLKRELEKVLSEEYTTATFSRINRITELVLGKQKLEENDLEKLKVR